jgi:hypothetical protein
MRAVPGQEMALIPLVAQSASMKPVGAPDTPMPAIRAPPPEIGRPPGRMLNPGM